MERILAIMIGGALGSYCRYVLSGTTQRFFEHMPMGTLLVNMIGSFLIGLLWGLVEINGSNVLWRSLVFVGFLGGFTTFSTYMLDTLNLMRSGEYKLAIINLLAHNIAGLLLVFAGFFLSRLLLGIFK
jgi:CrcB protein